MRFRRNRSTAALTLLALAATVVTSVPAAASVRAVPTGSPPSVHDTSSLWHEVGGMDASSLKASHADVRARRFRAFTLDGLGMRSVLKDAPREFSRAGRRSPLVLSLPAPDGGFQRFAVQESPIMAPRLSRQHPEIRTYDGRGLDDPTASIRFAMTPLGFSASVRGPAGMWYVEPAHHLRQGLYVSYFLRDLTDTRGRFFDNDHGHGVRREAARLLSSEEVAAPSAGPTIGSLLRIYRLALVSDPSYAAYWGAANVTIGKVLLMNRVNQIYEDDLAIRMDLVANNDLLNLDTSALATGTNGPCGAAACFAATQLSICDNGTLTRNRIVVGQLVGADNYDIGHIVLGQDGGGIASLFAVGRDEKAEGCTGIPQPAGDGFSVDYVAHEMGHEFGADHPFNGPGCGSDNRNQATSVEPGSGSTIMAYAGICGQDNLQNHSDPYFSQRSFEEITDYVTSSRGSISEVQNVSLTGFDGTDSFALSYNGNVSAPIVRGTNYTNAGIQSAIVGIPGWPGGTPSVAAFAGGGSANDTGFQLTFGSGAVAGTDVSRFAITNLTGATGFVGTTTQGGPVANQGYIVTPTGNSAPVVTAPATFTIPYRTPFALTGSGTDPNGDTLSYLWEQNDTGDSAGTILRTATKTNGPLFRVFGTALNNAAYDPLATPAGGQNTVTTNPTRVFPDMAQILANNTNADTGTCAGGAVVDCWSEFLPTSIYTLPMHFRLTARDGHPGAGGVSSADTTVSLAPGSGPFRVTSPNTAVSLTGGQSTTVTWDVAGSSAAPINTTNVRVTLSADGGITFPYTMAASTPNDGSESLTLPNGVSTAQARIKIEAVGNIFFDVSNANFTLTSTTIGQMITFDPIGDMTFGDPDAALSATASSGLPVTFTRLSGPCSVTGSTVHPTGAGSCTIAANQAGDGTFDPAPQVARSFTIAKANQSIAFGALPDKAFGSPNFTVSATASSGLPVAFTAGGTCTVSGSIVHLTAIGSCTINANQAGNVNFNAAAQVSQTFAVTKTQQSIMFGPLADKTFGDPNFSVSATATSGLSVAFTVLGGPCAMAGTTTVHLNGAGPCTIAANQAGNSTFDAAPQVTRTFTISKASQTITFAPLADKSLGDADFTVTATASSGLSVAFTASGACTVTGSLVHLTAVGSCGLTATQTGDANTNPAADVIRSFAVKPHGVATTTALAIKPKKAPAGKAIKATATVKAGTLKATGIVTIYVDDIAVGTANVNAKGKAVVTFTVTQSPGNHSVKATFTDTTGAFITSTSAPKTLKVT